MMKKSYYEILGISEKSDEQEIKRAYKRLAIKYHPDRNQGNKGAEEKFKKIKEAYEVLIDPKKRSIYDQYGDSAFDQNSGIGGGSSGFSASFTSTTDFGDIFGDVFGDIFGSSRKKRSVRGSDLLYEINLSLEEAVKGVTKEISILKLFKCDSCHGTGARKGSVPKICASCKGTGQIHMRQGFFTVQQTCMNCRGKGSFIKDICNLCYGSGKVKRSKVLLIKIPAGVNAGDKIRLHGEGELGENKDSSGDLYVKINIMEHSIFSRDGNNLYCEVPINFVTAALGGEIDVPTLDGKVTLKIPPEVQTGKIFRMRGKGVKSIRRGLVGDLMCRVIIETPVRLNEKQKNLLKEFGKTLNNEKNGRNSPKSRSFFNSVKRFFDDLTK